VVKIFYDATYGLYVGKDSKKQTTFPEFDLNLSLIDVHYIFKKDIIFEILYQDNKSNTPESLGYGGVFTFKLGNKRPQQSDKKSGPAEKQEKASLAGRKRVISSKYVD
jgi:hypothetical protein